MKLSFFLKPDKFVLWLALVFLFDVTPVCAQNNGSSKIKEPQMKPQPLFNGYVDGKFDEDGYDFGRDGIYYKILSSTTCEVVKPKGDLYDEACWYRGLIQIPATVVGKKEKTFQVVSIGQNAFSTNRDYKLIIPEGVTTIEENAFHNDFSDDEHLHFIEFPSSLTTIKENAFNQGRVSSPIVIPSGVKELPGYLFFMADLQDVTIPKTVKKMGEGIFWNATIHGTLTLETGVTQIPSKMFDACKVKCISIPEGVTNMGVMAFNECEDLQELHLPSTMKSVETYGIGEVFFHDCNNIEKVYAKMPVPVESMIFEHTVYTNATLYVPQQYINAYKNSKTWGQFLDIQPIQ